MELLYDLASTDKNLLLQLLNSKSRSLLIGHVLLNYILPKLSDPVNVFIVD